jgi:hypothetical protein
MILEPATSFAQGATRVAILSVLVVGFFGTVGAGLWLSSDKDGKIHRHPRLPFGLLIVVYLVVASVLVQFW